MWYGSAHPTLCWLLTTLLYIDAAVGTTVTTTCRASRLAAEHELSAASEQLRRQRESAREQEIQSLNGELEAVRALVAAAGKAQAKGDEVDTILYYAHH
jgi:hypothetical protein